MPHSLIKNKLTTSTSEYDLLLFGYYLTPSSFLLHIKRFDSLDGWNNNIEIFIDNDEKIIIEPYNSSSFIRIINTNTQLVPYEKEYEQLIPKIIVQTSESSIPLPLNKNCMESFAELNTEYTYLHFNSIQRRDFIVKHFDEKVVHAYDLLVSGAFQADIFRYCFLYINGGCYFDDKIIPRKPLREIISKTDTLLLCDDYKELEQQRILNALIMTTPKNELFFNLINKCVHNILYENPHNFEILSFTGPQLMYSIFQEQKEHLKFEHIIFNNDGSTYQNYQIIDLETKEILFHKTNTVATSLYIHQWHQNEILYKNYLALLNLKIFVSPNPYCDTFNFFTNNDKEIVIERKDSIHPWHFPLTVKIIENDTSQIKYITTFNRTIQLDTFSLKKPTNVFFSSESFSLNVENRVVVVLSSDLFHKIDYYRNTIDNAFIILTVTSLHNPLPLIEMYAKKSSAVIMYNNSLSYYFCHELKKPNIFIYNHISKLIRSCYRFIPIFGNKEIDQNVDFISNIDFFAKFCNKLLLQNTETDEFFIKNVDIFLNIEDIEIFYKKQLEKYNYIIQNLNEIVKNSGEHLEGNIFYEHNCIDYEVNKTFENKRKNLFLYSHLVSDIMEIGFNAGHSTFLYLIANPISKIQLFDLGEHNYSRLCFEYLNKEFPNRLSVVWGDSVQTLATFQPKIDYDLIHIDGGHYRFIAESDIRNCERISSSDTLVIFDDSLYDPLASFLYELINANYIIRFKPYYDTNDHLFYKYQNKN